MSAARLGRPVIAACGRAMIVWLAVGVIAATGHPLGLPGLVAVTTSAGIWLVCLRMASASAPFALGPWVPAAMGAVSGLVCVAAVNAYLPGIDLSLAALLAIALGVFLSAGTWDAVLERTAPRRVLVIGTAAVADVDGGCQRPAQTALRDRRRRRPHRRAAGARPRSRGPRRAERDRGRAAAGRDRADRRGLVLRRARAAARHDRPPLPRGRADQLLRVRLRLAPAEPPDADVVPQPAAPSPALRAAALEAAVRRRGRLRRPAGHRTAAAADRAAREVDARPCDLPADAARRRRPAFHDLQVPHDAHHGRAPWRADLRPDARPARDGCRAVPQAHAPRRAAAAVERPSRRHVDRRPAPRAPRVREHARGGHPVLEPATPDEAGRDGLGPGALRLRLGLRDLRREALLRLLVHAPRLAGRRHRGLRENAVAGAGDRCDPRRLLDRWRRPVEGTER